MIRASRKTFKESNVTVDTRSVILFGSKAVYPYHLLSNFAQVDELIEYKGLKFISAEHAHQSNFFPDPAILSIDGDYNTFDVLVTSDLFYPTLSVKDREKKKAHWEKKNNIGIIAKMLKGPKILAKLGIERRPYLPNDDDWQLILSAKFAHPRFRSVLKPTVPIQNLTGSKKNNYINVVYTGKEKLVEFDHSAKINDSFFGGMVDAEDGKLYGNNYMGKMLMTIRDDVVALKPDF